MGRIAQARISLLEQALDKLDRLAAWRGRTSNEPAHLATGLAGEDAAFFYLRRKGYTIVARRWSSGEVPGDVDLIAWSGPLLCFVEIKTRTAHDNTPAESAVNSSKRAILRRLARRYVRQLPQGDMPSVRFDVISVYLVPGQQPEFTHFAAAFGWNEFDRSR
ncbi:MAG TPA: YraN family protein [Terracidiphilus sp.]|jgi:putative endonuclease|nr:YraN family protein [Terracidiphilus sp.]